MSTATLTEFATIAGAINRQLKETTVGPYPFEKPFGEIYKAVVEWASLHEPNGQTDVLVSFFFEENVRAWVKVGHILSENWQEDWNDKYPFHLSFDELLFEISSWVDGTVEQAVERKEIVTDLFTKWDELKEKLAGWEVEHTGGGIFVAYGDRQSKEYPTPIMVAVSDEFAIITHDVTVDGEILTDKFISREQYLREDNEKGFDGYGFETQKVLVEWEDGKYVPTDLGKAHFTTEQLDEIIQAMKALEI